MLNGDFTAFASPACNAGRQVTLTGGFTNNQIDPSRLSRVALNFAKYLPTATADPCGRVQYGIPNNNTEHQGARQGRLHAEQHARRSSPATCMRSTRTPPPMTARTC